MKERVGAEQGVCALPPRETTPDPFVVLSRVARWDEHSLEAVSCAHGAWWEVLEAAAQACCLHQRWRSDFADHAFLLSLDRAILTGKAPCALLALQARLLGQSRMAARYAVSVRPGSFARRSGAEEINVELTVGHMRYDQTARKDLLREHYRGVWQCLTEER